MRRLCMLALVALACASDFPRADDKEGLGNFRSQDLYICLRSFLRGFVVSANLRNIWWPFYMGK